MGLNYVVIENEDIWAIFRQRLREERISFPSKHIPTTERVFPHRIPYGSNRPLWVEAWFQWKDEVAAEAAKVIADRERQMAAWRKEYDARAAAQRAADAEAERQRRVELKAKYPSAKTYAEHWMVAAAIDKLTEYGLQSECHQEGLILHLTRRAKELVDTHHTSITDRGAYDAAWRLRDETWKREYEERRRSMEESRRTSEYGQFGF
ncbi:hypothetical protein [Streptomyces abyssomicinicus]|uniref:hypothetical protein n=1 Tax=Streptomyces abyssomicinicus TaxID=574929 RepID=UPI00124FCB34|nr:hypothetical protein [Streptomyces abyssomicinicus]